MWGGGDPEDLWEYDDETGGPQEEIVNHANNEQVITVTNKIQINVNIQGVPMSGKTGSRSGEFDTVLENVKTDEEVISSGKERVMSVITEAMKNITNQEVEKKGEDGNGNAGNYIIVGLVVGVLICIILLAAWFCYRNSVKHGKGKRRDRGESWCSRSWDRVKGMCGQEEPVKVAEVEGGAGYLTPRVKVADVEGGACYLTPRVGKKVSEGQKEEVEEPEQRSRRPSEGKDRTGLFNWNYSSAEFEDSLYDEVGEGDAKEEVGSVGQLDGKGEVPKTNASCGIEVSKEYVGRRYENVPGTPQIPMPLGRSDGNREVTPIDSENDVFNSTGFEDVSFGGSVRAAIADVEAAHCQGEDRLKKVLESLEEKMRAEQVEELEIMENIQRLSEITPRRSARLEEKRLKRTE